MTKSLPIFLSILFLGIQLSFAQNLVDAEYKGSISKEDMIANYGFLMQYGVDMYKITYETNDVFGQLDTASGLLVLPMHDQPTEFPLLCYQHGTINSPTDVPSNLQGGYELATIFAAVGYVTTAADFLGMGESRGFHPYVHADSEASAAIDMLFAARQYADQNDILLNDQLFVTGYSQGGHAAAAAHRTLQENYSDEFTVTASAPMSGPYSISGEMRDVILSNEEYFFPAYAPNTILSYDYVYDLFDEVVEVFKEPYATVISQFYDNQIGLGTLNNLLITQLTANSGASVARNLFQDSIIMEVENNFDHPFNVALRDNDVYDWTPQAPTRLIYCQADDQVVYTNAIVADSVMNMNGAPDVMALNVNPTANHGQCVEPATISALLFFAGFQDITVDINQLESPSIDIYPNPARTSITIASTKTNSRYRLIDTQGRSIETGRLQDEQTTLDISQFANGLYFLQIEHDQKIFQEKIIIQK